MRAQRFAVLHGGCVAMLTAMQYRTSANAASFPIVCIQGSGASPTSTAAANALSVVSFMSSQRDELSLAVAEPIAEIESTKVATNILIGFVPPIVDQSRIYQ
jgi:hypothetical protein